MKRNIIILLFILITIITFSKQETILTIDDFKEGEIQISMIIKSDVDASSIVSNSTFYESPQGAASKSLLGGERDMELTVTDSLKGREFFTTVELKNGKGEWYISTPSDGSGYATMQYDGIDGGSMNINTTGLIGVDGNTEGLDLTVGGRAVGFTTTIQTEKSTDIQFNVYSPDGSLCSLTVDVPARNEQSVKATFNIFDGNCDFTKVGAIEIFIDAVEDDEISIFSLTLYGSTTPFQINIDTYIEGNQNLVTLLQSTVVPTNPVTSSSFYLSPEGINSTNILGGERDFELQVNEGNENQVFVTDVTTIYPQCWESSSPSASGANINVQYDGADNSMNLNVSGLIGVGGNTAGVDITQDGRNSGFNIEITTENDAYFWIYLYSPDGSMCDSYTMVQVLKDPTVVPIPFQFFSGNCNMQQIGAIEIQLQLIDANFVSVYYFVTSV